MIMGDSAHHFLLSLNDTKNILTSCAVFLPQIHFGMADTLIRCFERNECFSIAVKCYPDEEKTNYSEKYYDEFEKRYFNSKNEARKAKKACIHDASYDD